MIKTCKLALSVFSFFLFLSCCAVRVTAAEPMPVVLADGGKAAMPVVIAETASKETKSVADELAQYLSRISGATFEVQTGDGKTGIVLGTLKDFPHPELEKPLEMRGPYDGKEAFAIRTQPGRVLLIGRTDLAASHAAFRLLETLGCRWFFPSRSWEVVPEKPTLKVSLNVTDRPKLLWRRIWYGWGMFGEVGYNGPYIPPRSVVDYEAWNRHNHMAHSMTVGASHAWGGIIAEYKEEFEAHPEYLALVNGKRQGDQLCVSNARVRELAIDSAFNFFKNYPDQDMVSMETADGGGQCECAECAKLGSISDRVFGLANTVAVALQKEMPDKLVGMLAYNDHSVPPSFELEPNVYVQLTQGYNWGKYSWEELAEMWPKRVKLMGHYKYFSIWPQDYDTLPGGGGNKMQWIRTEIPRLAAKRGIALDAESGNNWGIHGRGYYIAGKLMWNPQADVDALLADFYAQAFGPAAAVMKRYYENFDASDSLLISDHLVGQGFRDVQEASRLAKDRPDVLARLDELKQFLRYVDLRWQYEEITLKKNFGQPHDEAHRKALVRGIFDHVYRSRYSYMNHWAAIMGWGTDLAQKFDEPTWTQWNPENPWIGQALYTRAETEELFQQGLKRFQPLELLPQTEYSKDLVAIKYETASTTENQQHYQGIGHLAFYSADGKPFEGEISAGHIIPYRNGVPGEYTIWDKAGKKIAAGQMPLDGEEYHLKVPLPGPGVYYMDGFCWAFWKLRVPATTPLSRVLDKDVSMGGGQQARQYFYVPKGTKSFQYYSQAYPHQVYLPDDTLLKTVDVYLTYTTIDVPEGMDGKVWSFGTAQFGHLWFRNIPNFLADSPYALLVPREVANKDGLTIRK